MGISGLLPALKAIQKQKHLSEFAGKRVAVDGYGWLHKGVYGCATDLALGKPTTKYVDFAMSRVNLLRHYRIQPYLVFDGGPLPAKEGTEDSRKQKRAEYLAQGRTLTSQGKLSQARECFVKAIDVTPEMAYQLIKALKAESVPYVVAPYEADAQLAYLEKEGFVDAILTEDSDLLVFGCSNVWFKLDAKAAIVMSISRSDFGSVTATASDSSSISLVGFDDSQFRTMAILSGCDYLSSIPGVGLKTACTLVKKWKTAEHAIRHISLEGKKSVPIGYLKRFLLAEKCFLHQRVYCPIQGRLVHLTPVDDDWNDEFDNYVGSDMDPVLAKSIAVGDFDPVSLKAMKDVNPTYRHGAPKRLPLAPVSTVSIKGKEKATKEGGLFNFFGAKPTIPPAPKHQSAKIKNGSTGKASGKRTLGEIADQETAQKQKKKHRNSVSPLPTAQSKFFSASTSRAISALSRRHSDGVVGHRNGNGSVAGPSRLYSEEKENDFDQEDDILSEPEADGSHLSMIVQAELRYTRMEIDFDGFPDVVEQEDGYISPTPCSRDVHDISSPPKPAKVRKMRNMPLRKRQSIGGKGRQHSSDEDEVDFDDIEAVSSPISTKRRKTPLCSRNGHNLEDYIVTPARRRNQGEASPEGSKVLVGPTPTPVKPNIYLCELASPSVQRGPDLRSMLGTDDGDTVFGNVEDDDYDDYDTSFTHIPNQKTLDSDLPLTPSPDTPVDIDAARLSDTERYIIEINGELVDVNREEEARITANYGRHRAVRDGMRQKFAFKPLGSAFGPSGPARERAEVFMKNGQTSPRRKFAPLVQPPAQKMVFASGSGVSRALNLKRNEVNVTPQGRHTILGPAPRSLQLRKKKSTVQLASKSLFGRQPGVMLAEKPRPSTSNSSRQMVDLTGSDSEDGPSMSTPSNIRAKLNLDQFRCT